MSEKRVLELTQSELRGTIQMAVLTANFATGLGGAVVALLLYTLFGNR